MPFELLVKEPMFFVPYPNLDKMGAAVFYAVHQASDRAMFEEHIHAVLFLASAQHMPMYGRPIVGDTWLRGVGRCGVFGAVLSSVIGGMKHRDSDLTHEDFSSNPVKYHEKLRISETSKLLTEFTPLVRDQLSRTDCDAISRAVGMIDGLSNTEIIQKVTTTALYGVGAPGSVIDWMDGLPDKYRSNEDARSDMMCILVHMS